MIDLSRVNEILKGTQSLAQAQNQAHVQQGQQTQQQANPGNATASQAATAQLFAQLGALLNNAANQPAQAQSDPDLAALQRQAALLNAKVTSLIAKADALEAELNLAPTPDTKSIDDLLAQFREIMAELNAEIEKLQKQIAERDEANKMKLKQKPTAMKPGEHVGWDDGDPDTDGNPGIGGQNNPFNTTFSVI
ncbi:MAG TPA: hypothetical protein V6D23_10355 [Candidatus Obscuribacterales bacterium]